MRAVAFVLIAALASGCAHTAVAVSSGTVGGTAVATTGTATLSSSSAAALLFVLTLGAIEYANNPQPFPSPSALMSPTPPAPELAANRRISEQDCSKPVDLTLGNLRCK